MDYERERCLAEQHAKQALAKQEWPLVGFHLYHASRMSLRMARGAQGLTRDSLWRLAKAYEARGDLAVAKLKPRSGNGRREGKEPAQAERLGAEDDETNWIIAERPETRLSDVAGMTAMKEIIQDHILLPVRHAAVYADYGIQPGSGVLMYGPPGNGKTFIARAIAGEIDAAFIPVDMKKVLSKWFGETEQLLAKLFEEARKHPRVVIFFDEAEALFPKRGATNSSVMARVVPQLLQLLHGMDAAENTVILLGATNRPWLMDEAATRPGRFGRLIYVGPPDREARSAMMRGAMGGTPSQDLDYDELAEWTEGYSGADIAGEHDSLCVEAKMNALKRTVCRMEESGTGTAVDPAPVTMTDFKCALERILPSIQQAELKDFAAFQRRRGRASGNA